MDIVCFFHKGKIYSGQKIFSHIIQEEFSFGRKNCWNDFFVTSNQVFFEKRPKNWSTILSNKIIFEVIEQKIFRNMGPQKLQRFLSKKKNTF